jgi:hypothetical protein
MAEFVFSRAVRRAVPMIMSLAGPSGCGKTYSALLLAAGLVGPKGRVGMLDTENGRGEMYADSPGIVQAFPDGFDRTPMDAPFSPSRYTDAIKSAEKAGIAALVIDSGSHEWEGEGGCSDIAEKQKLRNMPNWAKAKMEHKRFLNNCLSSSMHIVFCLRAREKTKIMKVNGKEEFIAMGMQPIAEKNFVFEMLLSLLLDETTHFASAVKLPQPLAHLFPKDHLITKADGEAIRLWNESGGNADPMEGVKKRARAAAEDGLAHYSEFFAGCTAAERKHLAATTHDANKETAIDVDAQRKLAAYEEDKLKQQEVPIG